MMMNTKRIVRPDGFVYLVIERNVAINLIHNCYPGLPEICILHDDGSDTLVTDSIDELYETEEPIGLAVGFISDMVTELQELSLEN